MSNALARGVGGCGFLAACFLTVALAGAQEPNRSPNPSAQRIPILPSQELVPSFDRLVGLSWPQLEQLYRQSQAGAIPEGYARGRAIYCPDSKLASVRSRVTNALWRGKIFDAAAETLVNQWCGLRAIKARVYYGPSWLDGKPSIIMDYSETSRVWVDVRDEVREVAPGLYLGLMYRRKVPEPQFQLYFVLEPCSRR